MKDASHLFERVGADVCERLPDDATRRPWRSSYHPPVNVGWPLVIMQVHDRDWPRR